MARTLASPSVVVMLAQLVSEKQRGRACGLSAVLGENPQDPRQSQAAECPAREQSSPAPDPRAPNTSTCWTCRLPQLAPAPVEPVLPVTGSWTASRSYGFLSALVSGNKARGQMCALMKESRQSSVDRLVRVQSSHPFQGSCPGPSITHLTCDWTLWALCSWRLRALLPG